MSPQGDMIKEFQHGRRGDLHKPQLPALHLHCPSSETLCGRLRNLIGKCCRECIRSCSNASASVVLAEIDRASRDGATSPYARYLQIFRIPQPRDREMARLFDNPRRAHALTMQAQIRSQGLRTQDELSRLSPETRGAIQMLLGAG